MVAVAKRRRRTRSSVSLRLYMSLVACLLVLFETLLLQSPAIRQPAKKDSSVQLLRSNTTSIPQPSVNNTTMLRGALPDNTKHHDPRYFLDQVELNLMVKRENIVTPHTGCSIAAFQYAVRNNPHSYWDDCRFMNNVDGLASKRKVHADTAERLIQEGDTLYVQFYDVQHFCETTLPDLHVNVVVVSGAEQKVDTFSKHVFDAMVAHPRVIHWFMMNMDIYSHDPHHPKISPWPYGVKPEMRTDITAQLKKQAPEKDAFIHLTDFNTNTNPQRLNIPNGPYEAPQTYLSKMHASKYIFSPDGDRPECYRHYEAIAMGAMPITQLDASTHFHLAGNAIFNNSVWNLTILETTLPQNPQVNQRLIFEEYWMEYVERIVGRPLRWWDTSRKVRSSLAEITDIVHKSSVNK